MSEGKNEALNQVHFLQEQEASDNDELLCKPDSNPTLVVTRALITNVQVEQGQRCSLFQTRANVEEKSIKVIIDGGNCHKLGKRGALQQTQVGINEASPFLSCPMA